MDITDSSGELQRLYDRFVDSIRDSDAESVRDTYRQLMHAGRPLAEILDHGIRAAANASTGFEELLLGPRDKEAETPKNQTGGADTGTADGAATIIPDAIARLDSIVTPALVRRAPVHNAVSAPAAEAVKAPNEFVDSGVKPNRSAVIPRILGSRISSFSVGVAISTGAIWSLASAGLFPLPAGLEKPRLSIEAPVPLSGPLQKSEDRSSGISPGIGAPVDPAELTVTPVIQSAAAKLDVVSSSARDQPQSPAQPTALETQDAAGPPGQAATPIAAPAPEKPVVPAADLAALLTRGDALFALGDAASARRFYERGADAGDGQAALRLGESYDPFFLRQTRFRGLRADVPSAVFWYKRARDLGMSEAEILLKGIQGE